MTLRKITLLLSVAALAIGGGLGLVAGLFEAIATIAGHLAAGG
jgi:hypothetical protein